MARPSIINEVRKLPAVSNRRLHPIYYGGSIISTVDDHSDRSSRNLAAAAHLRGTPPASPCGHCSSGSRTLRFEQCIVCPGFLKGKCTNCHWALDGRVCTFPENPPPKPHDGSTRGERALSAHMEDEPPRPTSVVAAPRTPSPGLVSEPVDPPLQTTPYTFPLSISKVDRQTSTLYENPHGGYTRIAGWITNEYHWDKNKDNFDEEVSVIIENPSLQTPSRAYYGTQKDWDAYDVGVLVEIGGQAEEARVDLNNLSTAEREWHVKDAEYRQRREQLRAELLAFQKLNGEHKKKGEEIRQQKKDLQEWERIIYQRANDYSNKIWKKKKGKEGRRLSITQELTTRITSFGRWDQLDVYNNNNPVPLKTNSPPAKMRMGEARPQAEQALWDKALKKGLHK